MGASPMDARFTDRVTIVTGAGSGLGRATAKRLAAEGAPVAALDVAEDAAEKVAAEIAEAGGRARAVKADVSDPASVRTAVDEVAAELGRPQVLVNSAGIGGFNHTVEERFERWSAIIAVNLTGTFLTCQAALPHLLDGGGAIVNIASNAGLMGQPYSAAYCASKGGVVNLTRALAVEYIKRGVRVNAVAPGGMNTPMVAGFTMPDGVDLKEFAKVISPLGYAEPEELAGLIAFVASDDARYMAGSIVSMDGGITA
jgi:NAD(P)-dependent dehydrogenase (short-subunit alcohol dehydrogenase family)